MDGVLNVNKPSGPTSHDVVARIRRITGEKRVGHAGTLDPDASGVLIVCLGNATRIVEYLMDWRKAYRAEAIFGAEMDSQDASGSIVKETDCSHVTREMVESVLPRFTGKIQQIPPMVSAVHHQGQRLYKLARAGQVVERQPRSVEVYSIRLLGFEPGEKATAVLDVDCSKGTYIRTLCADIGEALGCGGYMSSLVRTAVGKFGVEDAVSIETIEEKAAAGQVQDIMHSIDDVLEDMPSVSVSEEDAKKVVNGVAVPAVGEAGAIVRIHSPNGGFIAIGKLCRLDDGELVVKPQKVFARQEIF